MNTHKGSPPSLKHLSAKVARLLNVPQAKLTPVAGNWGLTVYRADTGSGYAAVKSGKASLEDHLEIEARMLADLRRAGQPIPQVLATTKDVLVTEWIEHDHVQLRPIHERTAAEALAALHQVRSDQFGYSYATQFGALLQPNHQTADWIGFFRDQRLLHYASRAGEGKLIDQAFTSRLERLAQNLEHLLEEPRYPALLHGDVWSGNILTQGAQLRAFVDPAVFAGHPEYELAYVTLHGTFGRAFFDAYHLICPISPDFLPRRRDIYLIVPLLQHAILSGPAYLHRIDRTLTRLGF